MGIPQYAVGCLQYAAQLGVGQFDLSKIDVRGENARYREARIQITGWGPTAVGLAEGHHAANAVQATSWLHSLPQSDASRLAAFPTVAHFAASCSSIIFGSKFYL